jgi:transposase
VLINKIDCGHARMRSVCNVEPHVTVNKIKALSVAQNYFNPLNTELNPICHLLALLETHRILHVSRIRVNGEFV